MVGFNYGNQAGLGVFSQTLVDVGSDHDVTVNGGGPSDEYQWKRNGVEVNAANAKTYTIPAINRANMGDYTCEITNPTTPGLTLATAAQRVLATATLQGRLLIDVDEPATVGSMTLLKINSTGAGCLLYQLRSVLLIMTARI
ncbi:MAG: immunoglobulin domain-containing protein [Cytophagales bacterium]|nr:immunoglobulin domain-containing protein [Cytophagales bacterium]